MSHAKDAAGEGRSPKIRVTVVIGNRYAFDTEVATGKQIKEKANIPAGFALYRRTRGGNEAIRDDDTVELYDGDHFFARPPGSRRALSDDQEDLEMKRAHFGHGTADAGTRGINMAHARSYDVLHHVFFGGRRRRVITRLAALSGVRPGDRVLDIGCGTGTFTRVMAEAVTPGGTALGVDPSPEAITRARRLTRLAHCTFSQGIAQALDAPDGSYDVVVSSLMIHHLPQTQRPEAIQEMFRVLRLGGRVLIADFRPPTNRTCRRLIGAVTSPAMHNNPVHLLDPMAGEAGFEQVGSGDLHPWIRYVQAMKPTSA